MEPERKLAARFGVNRATLRQALKVLVAMGVVRQRVGDGTYITADAFTILDPQLPSGKIPGATNCGWLLRDSRKAVAVALRVGSHPRQSEEEN